MRYAYAITAALLAGGAAATLTIQQPVGAQVAQNSPAVLARGVAAGPASFADLAAKLEPAVVNISTTQKVKVPQQQNPFAGTPFGDLFGGGNGDDDGSGGGDGGATTRQAMSLGSGFLISADGFVVTNNHVIAGGGPEEAKNNTLESVKVTLADHTEYDARVVGRDVAADLAVLKIDTKKPLPFVQFGDSTRARVGDWVIAIGEPFALGGTVTAGIISAIHRSIGATGPYDRFIQTDAAINSGNSGGPMFDMQGNVVGINALIYSPSGGNVGIGFAIPAEEAKPIVDVLMHGGHVKRGYLGIQIQPITDDIASALGLPQNHGEIVAKVEPGYAAAKAGIQQGDVIVRVNNQEVTLDNPLNYIVTKLPIGARVPIEVIRHGKHVMLTAVIAERPPESQLEDELNGTGNGQGGGDQGDDSAQGAATKSALGITIQALTPSIQHDLNLPASTRGVVIASVDPNSDAAFNGLKRGDVIQSINQTPVTTVAAAAGVIAEARKSGRGAVLLLIQRGNGPSGYFGVKFQNQPGK